MDITPENEVKVRSLKYKVSEDSKLLKEIVNSIVSRYSKDLDVFVEQIKNKLATTTRLSDDDVEQMVLVVPVHLYFLGSGLEVLGVESDTAKALRLDRYNDAFINANGTIPDKTADAELQVTYESLMELAYARSYKQLKAKYEVAMQLINSSRKVLEKRIANMRVDNIDHGVPRRDNR